MAKLLNKEIESWPPLAWVAICQRGQEEVRVLHGPLVECSDEWIAEAIWAGAYADGDFDQTDLVFGSGIRARGSAVTFVSSGSTVDRLCHASVGDIHYVSNSIAALAAVADIKVDPAYRRYFDFFFSVIYGLDNYERSLARSNPTMSLTYFDNLQWDGAKLTPMAKPFGDRRFADFSTYERFLNATANALADNMRDASRKTEFEMLGTLSSGYDSTTVAAICREHGLNQAICIKANYDDDGTPVADALNIETITIDREAWRKIEFAVVPFIAANSFGEEVHFAAAESTLRAKMLMTGYHGDKVWEKDLPSTGPGLKRGDPSGLAHAEFRLLAGYIHCPVPFWGARSLEDINRISHAQEMSEWDLGNDYNRPICRRIAETKGVKRESFGQKKSAASRWLHAWPGYFPDSSLFDYFRWLRTQQGAFYRHLRLPPLRSARFDVQRMKFLVGISQRLQKIPGYYRLKLNRIGFFHRIATMHNSDQAKPPIVFGFRRYVFPWAVDRLSHRYRDTLPPEHLP